jgi:hypothetical protein
MGSTYTLDQAQKDIAALRGTITHLLAFAQLLNVEIDGNTDYKGSATPAAPASGFLTEYANNVSGKSHLKYVSDDGADYATGRVTANAAGQVVSATTFTAVTGLSVAVGIGTQYHFRIKIDCHSDVAAGQWSVEILGPSSTGINYDFGYRLSSTATIALNVNNTAFATTFNGPATNAITSIWIEMEGVFTTTAAGNLSVSAKTSNAADTLTIYSGSTIEVYPIV